MRLSGNGTPHSAARDAAQRMHRAGIRRRLGAGGGHDRRRMAQGHPRGAVAAGAGRQPALYGRHLLSARLFRGAAAGGGAFPRPAAGTGSAHRGDRGGDGSAAAARAGVRLSGDPAGRHIGGDRLLPVPNRRLCDRPPPVGSSALLRDRLPPYFAAAAGHRGAHHRRTLSQYRAAHHRKCAGTGGAGDLLPVAGKGTRVVRCAKGHGDAAAVLSRLVFNGAVHAADPGNIRSQRATPNPPGRTRRQPYAASDADRVHSAGRTVHPVRLSAGRFVLPQRRGRVFAAGAGAADAGDVCGKRGGRHP